MLAGAFRAHQNVVIELNCSVYQERYKYLHNFNIVSVVNTVVVTF